MTDEFDKLQQQYHDATIDERNRLWPNFIRAIREKYPGLLEEFEDKFSSGEYLTEMFSQCMKRVLARPDLDAGRKTNAQEDAAVFMAAFDELEQADPRSRGLAFELAIRALFTGLRAGLHPDEVEKLDKGARTKLGRKGGKAPKREKPWEADVKKIAQRSAAKNAKASNPQLVQAIRAECGAQGKKPPASDRTLLRRVAKWRRTGDLPSRLTRK